MKLTNTYLSPDCTRKAFIYCDKNGHYLVRKIAMLLDGTYMEQSKRTYKHFHSAERAGLLFVK